MTGKHALPQPEEQPTVTIEVAAKALGIGRNAAYEAAAAGLIPCIRISPRRLVVPTAALRRLLQLDPPVEGT